MDHQRKEMHRKTAEEWRNSEEMVRVEVRRGCQLARELQHKMDLGPMQGSSCSNDDGAVRASLISIAAAIVTSFSNVITILSSCPSPPTPRSPMEGSDQSPLGLNPAGQVDHHYIHDPQQMVNSPRLMNSNCPMSSSKALDSTMSGTPSPLTLLPPASLQPNPHSETPPRSPKDKSPNLKRFNPISSQQKSLHPIPNVKEKLEATAALPSPLGLNENSRVAESSLQAGSAVKTEKVDTKTGECLSMSKRRKCMPKWTVEMPGSSSEQGNDAAIPEDGYAWRKYGQKDILGSLHPRSYYRCTYKREFSCPAIKYVQRSDDDSPVFHVTYKGEHICQSSKLFRNRSYSPTVFPMDSHSSFKLNSPCLTLSSTGSLQVGQCGPTLSTNKDFQMVGSYASTSLFPNPANNSLNTGLMCNHVPNLSSSKQAQTSKFGADCKLGNLPPHDPHPKDLLVIKGAQSCKTDTIKDGLVPAQMAISQGQSSKLSENLKLAHGVNHMPSKPDPVDLQPARNKPTSKEFKESVKQLIDHLCLNDERETYESSADQGISDCLAEHFSPANSEVLSNSMPHEFHQQSYNETVLTASLAATAMKSHQPPGSEMSEVVAEHIPKFELDFILDSPGSQQQMMDLQSLLFEA